MQPAFLAALLAASCRGDEKMWAQLLRVAFNAFNSFSFLDISSLGGRLAALNVLTQPPQLQAALVRAGPGCHCQGPRFPGQDVQKLLPPSLLRFDNAAVLLVCFHSLEC